MNTLFSSTVTEALAHGITVRPMDVPERIITLPCEAADAAPRAWALTPMEWHAMRTAVDNALCFLANPLADPSYDFQPMRIVNGLVDVDLFSQESNTGHRTWQGTDGRFYTGVDTWGGSHVCSPRCLAVDLQTQLGEWTVKSTGDVTSLTASNTVSYAAEMTDGSGFAECEVSLFDGHDYDRERDGDLLVCSVCERVLAGSPSEDYIDAALTAYLTTALWSEQDYDENGESLGSLDTLGFTVDDIDADSLDAQTEDVKGFLTAVWADVHALDAARVGHDFLLTRNRHGAGFWDGDYADGVGSRLTDAAHAFGTVDFLVGTDGETVYAS